MREYLINYQRVSLLGVDIVSKSFETYDEALKYAKTLTFGVTIYEAVTRTNIKHEITKLNENTHDPASKPDSIPGCCP